MLHYRKFRVKKIQFQIFLVKINYVEANLI